MIQVDSYNPNWPKIFAVEASAIKQALGNNCVEVYHIGSTAMPGLIAKPIIDIIAVVNDPKNSINRLEDIGYDWAGLEFLTGVGSAIAPRFYGGSEDLKFVLLEDLGQPHVSLVDSLTKGNPDKAIAALHRFMYSLAKMHGESFEHTEKYVEILKRLNLELSAKSAQHTPEVLEEYRKELPETFPDIEFPWEQIEYVLRSIFEPGAFTTFNHVDIAPDNTFDNATKNELRIFDFEHGIVCNLLDAVYLRMSMPTAWCAKSIPVKILEELDAIYRKELQKYIPTAKDDEAYYTAYTNACEFWMINTLQDVPDVMEKDKVRYSDKLPDGSLWNESENWSRPRIISRLQAFIDVSLKYNKLPELRVMAEKILAELKAKWPDAKPMGTYPAERLRQSFNFS